MGGKSSVKYTVPQRKRIMTKKTAPYIFLLPMIVLFAVFMVYPIIDSLILSFQDFVDGEYIFCGVQNYITMFHDPVFWQSLKNTFIYLIIQVPVMVVLSLILGVLVEQAFLKFLARIQNPYLSSSCYCDRGLRSRIPLLFPRISTCPSCVTCTWI